MSSHKQDNIMLPTNKFNNIKIYKDQNVVVKSGIPSFLRGECHFYKNIPYSMVKYFPYFYGSNEECSEIYLEYIKGIPVYSMYKMKLLKRSHVNKIFTFIDRLHKEHTLTNITIQDISSNYIDKLKNRFKFHEEYPFPDREKLQNLCLERLITYLNVSENVDIVPFIHGDLWFSNMMIDDFNNLKVLDMKGQVNNILTTAGDRLYDYGKIYQSILGYDMVLYNDKIDEVYQRQIYKMFEAEMIKRNINFDNLKIVTFSLVMGTFYFIENIETKNRVWAWIKANLLYNFL